MSLRLDHVSRIVDGETHIADVSLTLERGSINVLLGPTLSGKTSLLRLMAGLDRPDEGRVLMDNVDVTGISVRRRNVAMVYQQFINYPSLTVFDNIASPLRVGGYPRKEIERKVHQAAQLLRLDGLLGRKPLELSGGQQQRTALARALVKNADLVLLDEPLANLDYKLREELREELPRIFEKTGSIFVYATTEPGEALLLGGNTASLHEGRVVQFGPTLEVYRKPHDLRAAMVFSDPPMNLLDVTVENGAVHNPDGLDAPLGGVLSGLAPGRYTLAFRPNHLHVHRSNAAQIPIAVKVAVTEITGSESFVHVDFDGKRWVSLTRGVHNFEIDTQIEVYFDTARAFVFTPAGALVAAPQTRAGD
ncbi:ABC transporter ATP-binding protein [Varunaivibrio sulfuroxidans]|uniref:Carbohydrate ABC transporter ATP-binding protein (CUT1 family) n=1 Tax=Varunaivibrio sulfuroxidans TaxID=1773489 RepID=A0A4R3JGV3_9PROT|nr:ABC transporter ATP-binding protein [Varunaivibrio sulfuroxidans]TCS64000.1 carbohydrate ABC transporter ATP-binding protein (CUT1 family) [Varunaivibrio sulfuroxidans]WES31547.1 ABC transporter ATP-binding protein [Varunaivibrio sulfuroxidans]